MTLKTRTVILCCIRFLGPQKQMREGTSQREATVPWNGRAGRSQSVFRDRPHTDGTFQEQDLTILWWDTDSLPSSLGSFLYPLAFRGECDPTPSLGRDGWDQWAGRTGTGDAPEAAEMWSEGPIDGETGRFVLHVTTSDHRAHEWSPGSGIWVRPSARGRSGGDGPLWLGVLCPPLCRTSLPAAWSHAGWRAQWCAGLSG